MQRQQGKSPLAIELIVGCYCRMPLGVAPYSEECHERHRLETDVLILQEV